MNVVQKSFAAGPFHSIAMEEIKLRLLMCVTAQWTSQVYGEAEF